MPENKLLQSQELRQEQILAPQQLQSLEILIAPILELQEKISEELEQNPTLEQDNPPGEELIGDMLSGPNASGGDGEASDSKGDDSELAELFQLADSWQDSLPPRQSGQGYSREAMEKREHFFNSLAEEPSLQEQMIEQLRLTDVTPRMRSLGELIIGSIDEQGYLRSHLADLSIAANAELPEMERALDVIQSFDPPGIGARDLKECLLLQLKRSDVQNPTLETLIKDHLEDLGRNKLPQIAKKLKVPMPELYEMIARIRTLNPHPGSSISKNNPIFVIPEVVVEEKEGEFVVTSNDESLPRLRVSSLYRKLFEDPNTPEETKKYIKAKLTGGKLLIKSIEQRQSTIKRIAEVIVDTQYDFFKEGLEHLKPLTMQQVADKLDLHETTISRAIANKYIQTPMGLFEFKFFFTGGFQSQQGEELSSRSVKEKLRELVLNEDSSKPLSDNKIVKLLKEQGLPIARRTVAKYREEIGIPASHLRKEF